MELISVDDFETHEMAAGVQPADEAHSSAGYGVAPGQVA
jgi:hypothetical protein